MKKASAFLLVFFVVLPVCVFAQTGAGAVRDYVGLINQSYHPSIVSYFEKTRAELQKRGEANAVRNIDIILSGAFGSGFLYTDARGNFYVLTNNHVVAQAHTLSITFERADGTTRKIENLRIIATDEDEDLAILSIPAGGERPFPARGLTILTTSVEEGINVFAAGFPGLGRTPVWQFSSGMVSNAVARFPKSSDDDTMMGPFIQHTAQIDAGNSGGPLLVAQQNAPSGFAVTGINTLTGVNRQSANYAVPGSKIQAFINNALNPRPETFRAALDERLAKFMEGLSESKAVYPHISEFLSAVCIGENAEWATEEMFRRANTSVRRTFIRRFEQDVVGAMGLAVAWSIENNIRSGTSAIRASIKEVQGSDEEYTVIFTINNKDVSSVWIREYGNWRIKNFGTAATGDTRRVERRDTQRTATAAMRPNSSFNVEAGYAYLFDKAPAALYAGVNFENYGLNFYFAGSDLWSVGMCFNLQFPIPIGSIGLMPFARGGLFFTKDEVTGSASDLDFDIYFGIYVQGGLRVYVSRVPGLFASAAYQYNFIWGKQPDPFKMGLAFSVGYSF